MEIPRAIRDLLDKVSRQISQPQSIVLYSSMMDQISDIIGQANEGLDKIAGYESSSFLPVGRILLQDSIDEAELVDAILMCESMILESAKGSLLEIDSSDSLFELFSEAILLAEDGKYLGSQSLLAGIYGLIRDTRFIRKPVLYNARSRNEREDYEEAHRILMNFDDSTLADADKIFSYLIAQYSEANLRLVLMTLFVFVQTKHLEERDPKYTPSRNAMIHVSSAYFSRYNCLCFLLYVSEVFDLIYSLEGASDSLVRPKSDWV